MEKYLPFLWAETHGGRIHRASLHNCDSFSTYLSTGFVDKPETAFHGLGFAPFPNNLL